MSHNPLNIVNNPPVSKAQNLLESDPSGSMNDRCQRLVNSSDIVLFMKGSAQMPQCGFSANAVRILDGLNVNYKTFDILSNMEIRQGLKEFANWPTFPQLWVKGELMGGSDVMIEMQQSGELKDILSKI